MSRLLRYLLLSLTLLLCLCIVISYALLATSGGSRWLLQHGSQLSQSYGIELEIGAVDGSLLHGLKLHNLSVQSEAYKATVEQLNIALRPRALLEGTLQITRLELAGIHVELPAGPASSAPAPVQLPELTLPVALQLDQAKIEQLEVVTATDRFTLDKAAFSAQLLAEHWAITGLSVSTPALRVSGDATMEPRAPHAVSARFSAHATPPETGPFDAQLTLDGHALTPTFSLNLKTTSDAELQATGSLDLSHPSPVADIDARLTNIGWPLSGPARITAQDARLAVHGSADDYRLQISAAIQGEQLPPLQVQLEAQGDQQQLHASPLTLQGLDGTLTAEGQLSWAPALRWHFDIQAQGINPAQQFPQWPGSLAAKAVVSGGHTDQGYKIHAQINHLGGQLRDHPLRSSGGIDYHAGQLSFNAIDIISGPNRLQLNGQADSRYNLSFMLDAPNLNTLHPQLSGQAKGTAHIAGSQQAPAADIALQTQALAFDQLAITTLDINARWHPDGVHARAVGTALRQGENRIDKAAITLEGLPGSHQINIEASTPQVALSLTALGGLNDQRWQGTLNQLQLQAPLWDRWSLLQPAPLMLSGDAIRVSGICLQQQTANSMLCNSAQWRSPEWIALDTELRALPLKPLSSYLPGETLVEGALSGKLHLEGSASNLTGSLALRPSDGTLHMIADGEAVQIPYRAVVLDASMENGHSRIQGTLKLGSEGHGSDGYARGHLTLGPAPTYPIKGSVQASLPDLRLLEGFAPALEAVSGQIQLALSAAGTLNKPSFSGELALNDARARLPAAGLELSTPQILLQSNNSRTLRLKGEVHSGEGKLLLSGDIDPAAANGPQLDINIRGERFQAVRLPEAIVEIAPQLTLSGVPPYHLAGTLNVPYTQIELRELPASAVSVSSDEIIVGEEPAPRPAPAITAAVQVRVGDRVHFKGFGLSTRLSGVLDTASDARGGNSAYGKIDLHDGLYKAYGQYLKIEQGRLLFAGPTDNPDVDLRAFRESRDAQVRAYLSLRGPLKSPDLRVSSAPALPEAEALAYLLTGRGLADAGKQEGTDITAAALSLGLSRSEPLLQKMGDRLGLDDLRLEDNGNGNAGSSLLLGKYLRPDLYLGYLQNLLSPQGVALLRLHLSEKLDLETRAGTTQSIDLLYKQEYD